MKKLFNSLFILSVISLSFSCDTRTEAEKIVGQSIVAHGGEKYWQAQISFDFRDIHYDIFKSPNRYEYSREFVDSTGQVKDVLNNEGFTRTVNGVEIDTLSEERIGAFSRSVNSVAYFAYLPYGLNDPAAIKSYEGITEINGERYHEIKVTFKEEGGGEDFDDIFLYWIGVEDYYVDYLAYSYHTDGGGVRFRAVKDVRTINGIRFQNYLNYKPESKDTPVDKMRELYISGELELLSEINLENIEVQ
ncbi:DUF6503 family protein [Algoriphagus namhaensis]